MKMLVRVKRSGLGKIVRRILHRAYQPVFKTFLSLHFKKLVYYLIRNKSEVKKRYTLTHEIISTLYVEKILGGKKVGFSKEKMAIRRKQI